jgi:cell wall-associated protease
MKSILLMALFAVTAQAGTTIAVIDSGLDTQHTALAGNIWTNARETNDGRDNDGNGYQDDIHGWNFANGNNQVIDRRYLGTFSADTTQFFAIQGRMMLGTASESDKAWYRAKLEDKDFVKELGKFGNFVHGTHVAGIAVRGTNNQAMGLKLIPTEVGASIRMLQTAALNKEDGIRMRLLKGALSALAQQQMNLLEEIGLFLHGHGASVANGSFGTGFNQAKTITNLLFKAAFFRDPTPEESELVARHFLGEMLREGQRFVRAAPNTLFVFAAGNDGSDNDKYPTSPTNIRADNVISVAATYDIQFMASFSNYGAQFVDVAAPGMLIDSTIPGNAMLQVSGTSQAAPFVAQIAGVVKAENPALTPAEVKALIIGTVDLKDFLRGKVLSNGVVNAERARTAAQLSRTMGVREAVSRARGSVRDQLPAREIVRIGTKVAPMPLTPMFR